MKIVDRNNKITLEDLKKISRKMFSGLVKAVVDIEKEIMVIGGEMHADEESFLIGHGSTQRNLWGINLYPQNKPEEFIEFDSIINLRPGEANLSRYIENKKIRKKIITIVNQLIIKNELLLPKNQSKMASNVIK